LTKKGRITLKGFIESCKFRVQWTITFKTNHVNAHLKPTYHGQRSKNLISYPKWSTNHSSVKNNNIDKQFSGMSNRRMQRIPLGKMIKNNFDCSLIILMFTKKPGHYRPISKGTLNNLTFYDNYILVLLRFHQHANLLLPEKWEPNNKLIWNIFYKQNSVLWIDSYSFECEKQPTNYHVKLWHF